MKTPPPTPYNFISLGAGVQSSTMLLMAAHGEFDVVPDAAIFADTQDEPKQTTTIDPATGKIIGGGIYGWLDWLEEKVKSLPNPIPIYRVTVGNLFEDQLEIRTSKNTGKKYVRSFIPAFVLNSDGTKGLLGRKCTTDYKIRPVVKKQRELAGIKRGQKEKTVTNWIGISDDEIQRMKPSREPWSQNRWPLVEMGMSRRDCLSWLSRNGYPVAPRSACAGCPFHGDAEWKHLKQNAPEDFMRAVYYEKKLQEAAKNQEVLRGIPYFHQSCIPLDEIEFGVRSSYGQIDMFGNECSGMCGV